MDRELNLTISLYDCPHSFNVAGKVVWITPQTAHTQHYNGTGVALSGEGADAFVKKVEVYLAGSLNKKDKAKET